MRFAHLVSAAALAVGAVVAASCGGGSDEKTCDPSMMPVCATDCEEDFSTVPFCEDGAWGCSAYPSAFGCVGAQVPVCEAGAPQCVCAEDDNSYSNGTTRWRCPPDDSGTKWAPTDGGGDAPIDALEPPYADVVADVPPDVVADAPPTDAPDE